MSELPAGRELNERVGRACGFLPTTFSGVSRDDGQSWCAWVDREHGPWYSYSELQEWLDENQENGRMLDHKLINRNRWPNFSEDRKAASSVFFDCFDCQRAIRFDGEKWWATIEQDGKRYHAPGETAELAMCRVALMVKEKQT